MVGGVSLTDDYRGAGTSTIIWSTPSFNTTVTAITATGSHDFAVGPKVELSLPRHFSFEVDALHRNRWWSNTSIYSPPLDFGNGLVTSSVFRVTGSSWEVPLLLKYHTLGGIFVEAGASLRPWL